MSKNHSLKLGLAILFVISVTCAVTIQSESIRYIFTAVAFLLMGIYYTAEYKGDRQKSFLYFSIMFYCFSLSAVVFAIGSGLGLK